MRIAFLGLGRMGVIMAGRLVTAGHNVTVWNRTQSRAAPLVEAGAQGARTPSEAVSGRDLVVSMLGDPPAVDEVFFGDGGAAQGLTPGALVVEMSTIGPAPVASLRAKLPPAVRLVDAPVLGSLPQATAGELKIFVGGSGEDVAACREVLTVLGDIRHIGPLGDGAAAKLVMNIATVTSFVMLGEALALADRLGLGNDAALDALAETAAGPLIARIRGRITDPAAPAPFAPTSFALGLAEKDLALALAEGADPDGVVAAARAQLATGREAGLSDRDVSAIIGFLRGADQDWDQD